MSKSRQEEPMYGPRTKRRRIEEERHTDVSIPSRPHVQDLLADDDIYDPYISWHDVDELGWESDDGEWLAIWWGEETEGDSLRAHSATGEELPQGARHGV